MSGHYDYGLVLVSYLVAVLAGYSALFFGAQLSRAPSHRTRWLCLGALTMGTGIWTMHFVGMQAHRLELVLSYDLLLTVLSWLAAVTASGLALHRIGLPRVSGVQIAVSTLFMASGIVVMHYVGMEAMRLTPGLTYHWPWVTVSVVIALAASAGAMILSRRLAAATGKRARLLHAAAALVMGAAISGMHYSGMVAVSYPAGASPHPGNLLAGGWMGIPLAVTIGLLLVVAIAVVILDRRAARLAAAQAEADRQRLEQMAFEDGDTGLPNRSALDQQILDRIVASQQSGRPFALLYLTISNFRHRTEGPGERATAALAAEAARGLQELIKVSGVSCWLARYSDNAFAVIVDGPFGQPQATLFRRVQELVVNDRRVGASLEWQAGQSLFPDGGASSRSLIRNAMVPRTPGDIGVAGLHPTASSPAPGAATAPA